MRQYATHDWETGGSETDRRSEAVKWLEKADKGEDKASLPMTGDSRQKSPGGRRKERRRRRRGGAAERAWLDDGGRVWWGATMKQCTKSNNLSREGHNGGTVQDANQSHLSRRDILSPRDPISPNRAIPLEAPQRNMRYTRPPQFAGNTFHCLPARLLPVFRLIQVTLILTCYHFCVETCRIPLTTLTPNRRANPSAW
jgi:hypothetical protein